MMDRAAERLAVAGFDRLQRQMMLVDQLGRAEATIDHTHEGTELQPESSNQLVERVHALGAIEAEMKVEISLHIGVHIASTKGLVHAGIAVAELFQACLVDMIERQPRSFGLEQEAAA